VEAATRRQKPNHLRLGQMLLRRIREKTGAAIATAAVLVDAATGAGLRR
jgi:hypothetical protein